MRAKDRTPLHPAAQVRQGSTCTKGDHTKADQNRITYKGLSQNGYVFFSFTTKSNNPQRRVHLSDTMQLISAPTYLHHEAHDSTSNPSAPTTQSYSSHVYHSSQI